MLPYLLKQFAGLPGLMQLGLLVFAIGGSLDALYHAAPLAWIETMDSYLGPRRDDHHLAQLR